MSKRSTIFTWIGVSIALLILTALFGAWWMRRAPNYSPSEHIELAVEALKERDFLLAYGHYNNACIKEPQNPDYQWNAAKLAIILGRQDASRYHNNEAWLNGHRSIPSVRLFTQLEKGDRKRIVNQALIKLEELPDSYEKSYYLGEMYTSLAMYPKAIAQLQKLMEEQPSKQLALEIVQLYIQNADMLNAVELIHKYAESGMLNDHGFFLLLSILTEFSADINLATLISDAHAQLEEEHPVLLTTKSGLLSFIRGELDISENYYQQVIEMPFLMEDQIEQFLDFCYTLNLGKTELDQWMLSQFSEPVIEYLKAFNPTDLTSPTMKRSIILDLQKILNHTDLSKAPHNLTITSEPSEHFHPKVKNRIWLSELYPKYFKLLQHHPLYIEAQTYLATIYSETNRFNDIREMKPKKLDHPNLEFLTHYCDALLAYPDDKNLSKDYFDKAELIVPDHPLIKLHKARLYSLEQKFNLSSDTYGKLISLERLYEYSALIATERAQCEVALGENLNALGILSLLHAHNIYSKSSLTLYRDLSLVFDDPEKGNYAQELLGQFAVNDGTYEWGQALKTYHAGDVEDALKQFESLYLNNSDNDSYNLARMTLWIELELYQKTLDTIEKENKIAAPYLAMKARAYFGLNKTDLAIESYEAFLKRMPRPKIEKELVELYIEKEQYLEATQRLERLAKLDPEDTDLWYLLGKIQLLENNVTLARNYLEKVDQLNLEDNRVFTLLAQLDYDNKEYYKTISQCERILNIDEKHIEANQILTQTWFDLKDWRKTNRLSKKLAELNALNEKFNWQWVIALERLGNPKLAISKLEHLLKENDDKVGYLNKYIDLLIQNKDYSKANDTLTNYKAKFSAAEFAINEAILLIEKKQEDAALQKLKPHLDDKEVFIFHARLNISNQKFNYETFKDNQHLSDINEWAYLADTAELNKNHTLAIQLYKKALSLDSEHPMVLNNLAWNMHLANQSTKEALTYSIKAHDIMPGHSPFIDTLSHLLIKAEDYKKTVELLERYQNIVESKANLLYYLAQSYEKLGKPLDAVNAYSKCRQFYPPREGETVLIDLKTLERKINTLSRQQ